MQKTLETWVLSLRLTAWNQVLLLLLFSHSVVSDSLQPHGLQHARLPCPSPIPGACSNSMSIELVMPSYHLILFCPLLLLPPVPPSIRVFSNESALRVRWPKYWSFSFSISPSNEHPGLISFRMDWLDLLAVQGTLNVYISLYKIDFSSREVSLDCHKRKKGPITWSTGTSITTTDWLRNNHLTLRKPIYWLS